MKTIALFLFTAIFFSCSTITEKRQKLAEKALSETSNSYSVKKYEVKYDKTKISKFTIISTEDLSHKAIDKNLSEYSLKGLKKTPIDKKISYSIVVPTMISKVSLENTLKYIVAEKIQEDNDIDEIIIFAYDHARDIGNVPYTFGKLIWAPNGELGNVTPQIASKNIRDNYKFNIDIKEKVGNIKKEDIPTERELAIYDMIMDPAYATLSESELDKLVMKKFGIKSQKELDRIFIKVMKYKN